MSEALPVDPAEYAQAHVQLTFRETSQVSLGALRYDLESASTLLAGFAWVGAAKADGSFRRADWEPQLRVVRLHYGSPFQLDVVAIEGGALAVMGGLATLSLCFERVASGIEKLGSARKYRAEAREIDRRAASRIVADALDRTASELPAAGGEKLRELSRGAVADEPEGHALLELGVGTGRLRPDQSMFIGRAFRRIALRGGRITFKR